MCCKIKQAGFKIKPIRYYFFKRISWYFGVIFWSYEISTEGISSDPYKVDIIKKTQIFVCWKCMHILVYIQMLVYVVKKLMVNKTCQYGIKKIIAVKLCYLVHILKFLVLKWAVTWDVLVVMYILIFYHWSIYWTNLK